jgi:hypothetical protein
MFKWFKEIKTYHENKREVARYSAFLLGEVANLVLNFKESQKAVKESGITEEEAIDIMKKVKDLDQKDIVGAIVDAIKTKSGE